MLIASFRPTVAMGLEDLVPVALTGAAIALLASRLGRPWLSVAAGLLVTGGLAKAGWKLWYAVSGTDHPRLADALFPLLGPGFALAAFALWMPRRPPWPAFAVGAATELLALVLRTTGPLLALTVIGSTAVTAWLVTTCWRARLPVGVALALGQLMAASLLARLATAPEQTTALQWIEQSGNTAGAFALLGAAHLAAATRRRASARPAPLEVSS
jgi:hypothetical protein